MANSIKELMGLTAAELIGLGAQHGLSFGAGMKKRDMVQQLSASVASGWMDVHNQLTSGIPEADEFSSNYGDASMISDAARVAQMISGAGLAETDNKVMSGGSHPLVEDYLRQLGVATADVSLHMPRSNPNYQARSFNSLSNFLQGHVSGVQDIMPEMSGHYSGDFLQEYATPQGNIADSYEHLAHMYLDISRYTDQSQYTRDLKSIAGRLPSYMGSSFMEVAASNAMGALTSYTEILPMIGDDSLVGGTRYPRHALNSAGLPLGSSGSAVGDNGGYSFAASATGSPGWSDVSKAVYHEAAGTLREMAKVYRGGSEVGLNPTAIVTSARDMIMDSASRYEDIFDVRHGYASLEREVGEDPSYSRASIEHVINNSVDRMESEQTFSPAPRSNFAPSGYLAGGHSSSTEFSAAFEQPLFHNVARTRIEEKAIANYDSIPFRDVSGYGTGRSQSPVTYHDNIQQGSDEWLEMRKGYDITGSSVGAYLGNSNFHRPWKAMVEKVGLAGSGTSNEYQQSMFAAGHAEEERARRKVSDELGVRIGQTGAITNSDYPSFMYSPDGLIGDDALWEHKYLARAKNFADLNNGDHPDYMDQVQLGMLVSGRSRTLFSQTKDGETQSQWIDRDEGWYERSRDKIDSTLGRLDAGRAFIARNSELPLEDLKRGARDAMQGEGIWKDISQRSNRGYDELAGTSADPFIGRRSSYSEQTSFGSYTPNFTMPEQGAADAGPTTKMAEAVKLGILGAQEENRQRGYVNADVGGGGGGGGRGGDAGLDADFEPEDWFNQRGGRPAGHYSVYDELGRAGGRFAEGIAGGSIASAKNGAMGALMTSPWGAVAAVAIGGVSITGEAIEGMNEYYGQGLDAGLSNPVEYASMSQGLETLGLSENQANSVNATTHSAYNTLLNGDPSGVLRIVRGTRGLITGGDIRDTQGDPVALARLIQSKGKERNWSQARIAGAMQMAGLDGMARAFDRTEYSSDLASGGVQAGRLADYSGTSSIEMAQSERAQLRPNYLVPQFAMQGGSDALDTASEAMFNARHGGKFVSNTVSDAVDAVKADANITSQRWHDFIGAMESGGDRFAESATSSAKGLMQVLSSTATNPGFGVTPIRDNSPEERERVGRDYADAMRRHYGGDYDKANAAYTEGPGAIDKLVDMFGSDWLKHAPAQAKKRVAAFHDTFGTGSLNRGAGSFGQSAAQPTQINVNISAKVNGQQATATVSATGGQTTTQRINMGNSAMERR